MRDSNEKNSFDPKVVDFMLAEYELLRQVRAADIAQGDTRTNLFLGLVSGAVALLAVTSQISKDPKSLSIISVIILTALFLLGLMTYIRLVERIIIVTFYTRGMNRIRRFFSELDPSINKFLILPTRDNTPKYFRDEAKKRIGLRGIVAVLNSIIAACSVFNLLAILFSQNLYTWVKLVISLSVLIVVLVALEKYSVTRLRLQEEKASVEFPQE